jgi:methyl-accepting chemotaxis protein
MRWNLLRGTLSRLRGRSDQGDARPDGGQVTATPGGDAPAESESLTTPDEDEFDVDDEVLLDGIGQPVFMVCTGGKVRAWNRGMERLTGVSAERAIGTTDVASLFYDGAAGSETMVDRILDAPTTADEVYGLAVEDRSRHLYVEEEVLVGADGEEHYTRATAMPLYEDGELVGVLETIQDLTEERERQDATEALVDEVSSTLQALSAGQLDARASFDHHDAINPRLVGVVDEVNQMADDLQDVVTRVDEQAALLGESVERAVAAAGNIAQNVGEQNDLLTEGVSEMQTFSASMEEVAATAEQVDAAAEMAREAANEGLDASEDAREATDEVTDIGKDLVDSVTDLGERMDDIEDVVEVISDVAEQTNLLALNANIEAARAGKDGDGFAVVAEEVKTLADETRQHTEQITTNIDELQNQTDSTVVAAEQSHQQIANASDQIADVLTAFEDIATAIDQSADGIAEVSRATDDQAATVEELTSTLEEAREHAEDTEEAADNIVAATDDQTEAIDELEARVRRLRDGQSEADEAADPVSLADGGSDERRESVPRRDANRTDGGSDTGFEFQR